MLKKIRPWVFWPPFALLIVALITSMTVEEGFKEVTGEISHFILERFGWLFSISTFLMVITCLLVFFSKTGSIRIGGASAKPILTRWRWFTIIICTTVAVGLLFWGTAEPIYHMFQPPAYAGVQPGSSEAIRFSLSTMFLHWSFTPYAIYTVPALMFALGFYNRKSEFSLSSTLFSLTQSTTSKKITHSVDAICLYALVAGMAASLGTGVLTISGGIQNIFELDLSRLQENILLFFITVTIVAAFILSAASGLLKGIRILSNINILIFIAIWLFVFTAGPILSLIEQAAQAYGSYALGFVERSLNTGADDSWVKSWTIFYWANWLSWAPITAIFLGRISYGYTVREFMIFNWVIPAVFAILWMSVFSGSSLNIQASGAADLKTVLDTKGYEALTFAVFDQIPMSVVLSIVFLLTAFISYVTAADSNTEAISLLSTSGISTEKITAPLAMKITWGTTIGSMAYIMIMFSGIDGIKTLSNLGGLPALLLITVINIALLKFLYKPERYIDL